MQQLDLFPVSKEDFLYQEMGKLRDSLDRRSRAIFSLISEIQDQLISLREVKEGSNEKLGHI